MNGANSQPIAHGRTAEIYAWDEGRVLKLFRESWGRGAAEHEFAIARAVCESGAPAPQAFELIEQQGRPGIVYEKVQGESLLRRLTSRPWQVKALARTMAETHAGIHRRTAANLPSQRQRMLRMLGESPVLTVEEQSRIASLMEPLPDGEALCHGDFHPDNVLISNEGVRVIDWNNATRGNRDADVGWTLTLLAFGGTDSMSGPMRMIVATVRRVFVNSYLNHYIKVGYAWKKDLDAWRLPCAAVRLSENIPGEMAALQQFVRGN